MRLELEDFHGRMRSNIIHQDMDFTVMLELELMEIHLMHFRIILQADFRDVLDFTVLQELDLMRTP